MALAASDQQVHDMNILQFYSKIRPLVARLLFLAYKIGLITGWYKLYRLIYERKYNSYALDRYASIHELVNRVKKLTWIPDKMKELFDAMSSAQTTQYRILNEDGKIGDCDEFATYESCIIHNEIMHNQEWFCDNGVTIRSTCIMSITWLKTGGKVWKGNPLGFGGHNVCVMQMSDGSYLWMDYNYPTYASSIDDIVRQVRDAYAIAYKPLTYALINPHDASLLKVVIA